jgi:hypothetical protein
VHLRQLCAQRHKHCAHQQWLQVPTDDDVQAGQFGEAAGRQDGVGGAAAVSRMCAKCKHAGEGVGLAAQHNTAWRILLCLNS